MGKIVCVCGFCCAVGLGDAILRETADILVVSDWLDFNWLLSLVCVIFSRRDLAGLPPCCWCDFCGFGF